MAVALEQMLRLRVHCYYLRGRDIRGLDCVVVSYSLITLPAAVVRGARKF